jgi:hypothetical protein
MGNAADNGASDRSEDIGDRSGGTRGMGTTGVGGPSNDAVTAGTAPVSSLPRTDFVLEFAWIPTEKSKRELTPASKWDEQMKQAGKPNRKVPEALLKRQDPGTQSQPTSGASGLNQPQPSAPPAGEGAPAQPGAGQLPGTQPGTGTVPNAPPGSGQPPNNAQPNDASGAGKAGGTEAR